MKKINNWSTPCTVSATEGIDDAGNNEGGLWGNWTPVSAMRMRCTTVVLTALLFRFLTFCNRVYLTQFRELLLFHLKN